MPLLVGTSGWQYRDWRGAFYPERLPQRGWLAFYSERFVTIEVNNAFYRLPDRDTFAHWAQRSAPGSVFAVKASRYLTHVKRLHDPEEPVHRLLDHAQGLGAKLGPVLVQLPPNLPANVANLEATLRAFAGRARVAVEFRHDSWFTDEVRALLERHDAALCLVDRLGPLAPQWRTASWGYLRLHEGRAQPRPCYGRRALAGAAERLRKLYPADEDVFVYFNNDTHACAVGNAATFIRLAERHGFRAVHP